MANVIRVRMAKRIVRLLLQGYPGGAATQMEHQTHQKGEKGVGDPGLASRQKRLEDFEDREQRRDNRPAGKVADVPGAEEPHHRTVFERFAKNHRYRGRAFRSDGGPERRPGEAMKSAKMEGRKLA